jgi:hypothetical protein
VHIKQIMEDANKLRDMMNADLSPNVVTLLERRQTKPLTSYQKYVYPKVQPTYASEARGENPWTGQTAEEVHQARYSQQQHQRLQQEKKQAALSSDSINSASHEAPAEVAPYSSPLSRWEDHIREIDEFMLDTAM